MVDKKLANTQQKQNNRMTPEQLGINIEHLTIQQDLCALDIIKRIIYSDETWLELTDNRFYIDGQTTLTESEAIFLKMWLGAHAADDEEEGGR